MSPFCSCGVIKCPQAPTFIYTKFRHKLLNIWSRVRDMSGTCEEHIRNMSGTCQEHVRNMSELQFMSGNSLTDILMCCSVKNVNVWNCVFRHHHRLLSLWLSDEKCLFFSSLKKRRIKWWWSSPPSSFRLHTVKRITVKGFDQQQQLLCLRRTSVLCTLICFTF